MNKNTLENKIKTQSNAYMIQQYLSLQYYQKQYLSQPDHFVSGTLHRASCTGCQAHELPNQLR